MDRGVCDALRCKRDRQESQPNFTDAESDGNGNDNGHHDDGGCVVACFSQLNYAWLMEQYQQVQAHVHRNVNYKSSSVS